MLTRVILDFYGVWHRILTLGRVIHMELCVKRFEELTVNELYEILKLRNAVFVVEQNCAYQECDDKDKTAFHVWLQDNGNIVAYLRVMDVPPDTASLGRVIAVQRQCGMGTRIVQAGIRVARERTDARSIKIHAQSYARRFYEKQGFRQEGEEFLEDGIPHILMTLDLMEG